MRPTHGGPRWRALTQHSNQPRGAACDRRRVPLGLIGAHLLVVLACTTAGATKARPGQGTSPTGTAITEISLERQCFGCPEPYRLTFRRDGTATRFVFGVGRQGTKDRSFRGTVAPAALERLVAVVQREGFFTLSPAYRVPDLVDGAWATTRVAAGERTHSVLNHNEAGPPAIAQIENAIDALGKTIAWQETAP
jgi:hypothetical protein